MDTFSILTTQYGGKAVVPIDIVCRDYFAPLTVPTLVRKIGAGEIELALVRIEHSRKSARGVRVQDLAAYIDAKGAEGAARARAGARSTRRDDRSLPPVPKPESSNRQSPPLPPSQESVREPMMEQALTLKMAAELLAVSYGTVYAHRAELGFFQIGSVWRVWPDTLRATGGEARRKSSRAAADGELTSEGACAVTLAFTGSAQSGKGIC
ncbi:pyocin activator PrtN family protein [Paraburkholderia jirisanensis]